MLKKRPEIFIEVQGHSDHLGDEKDNQVLSFKEQKKFLNILSK